MLRFGGHRPGYDLVAFDTGIDQSLERELPRREAFLR
jgi:hypothetical protein